MNGRATDRTWQCILGGGLILAALYVMVPYGVLTSVTFVAVNFVAALVIVLAVRRRRPLRPAAWLLLAGAVALTGLGDATWFWLDLRGLEPFPSTADAFYLSAYGGYAGALWMLGRRGRRGTGALNDALIVAIAAGVVAWVLLMAPYWHDSALTMVQRLTSVAYPVGDLALLTVILRLVFRHSERVGAYLLILMGVVAYLGADVLYALGSAAGWYAAGHPIDGLWLAAYTMFAAAAWHPSAAAAPPAEAHRASLAPRLVALATASVFAPMVILVRGGADFEVVRVAAVASILLVLLIVYRMAGLLRETRHQGAVLERSERNFRTIAEHSPDIILRYDRDLRHVYVNPMVERKTGIPAAALLGKTNREVGAEPLELIELWERTCREAFKSGQPQSSDFTYPAPEGPLRFQSHSIPELDHHGDVHTVLVVARDLTERHSVDEQRRDALSRLVTAQEDERTRIAGDIHDDSIQVMVAAGMRLEVLKREFPDAAGLPAIMRLEDTVRNSIARLRSLMFELRPPELDREGIGSALRAYCDTAFADDTLDWELVDDLDQPLSPDMRTVLYRIALEALTNVRKHAKAARVQVILDEADDGVRLQVHDDGAGFDTADLDTVGPHHLGTVTMGERAEGAGGQLDITSEQGTGTTVSVWIPTTSGATP